MTVFLTSHTGGWDRVDGKRIPAPLNSDNGFTDHLKSRWNDGSKVMFIAADPIAAERNDSIRDAFLVAFPMSGLSISDITICDGRNEGAVQDIHQYDAVILSGGHVPTQNAFFQRIGLKDKLEGYEGIVIGISAGTMNCAQTVYAHPELDGEAIDPNYRRFLPGLGLTKLMILPHYQVIKNDVLDGLRVFEDIAYPDSHGRVFYALADGSYAMVENGTTTLYGEGWRIKDGAIQKIYAAGQHFRITEA